MHDVGKSVLSNEIKRREMQDENKWDVKNEKECEIGTDCIHLTARTGKKKCKKNDFSIVKVKCEEWL